MVWPAGGTQGPEGLLCHTKLRGFDPMHDGNQRRALKSSLFRLCLIEREKTTRFTLMSSKKRASQGIDETQGLSFITWMTQVTSGQSVLYTGYYRMN